MSWYDEVDKQPESRFYPAGNFQPSNECAILCEHFEGFSPTAYLDRVAQPNLWTVGHGFTKGVKKGDTITYKESLERKRKELAEHWNGLKSAITAPIDQNICDALSSWAYNVGVNAARNSTLVRILNNLHYPEAADQLLRWDKAGGRTIRGLTRRRNAERELFLGGDWRKFYE